MLKTCGAAYPVRDRVVAKTDGEHGEELLCEPAASVHPYIASYRIARDGKGAYFQGDKACKRAYFCYDVFAYAASGELLDVLRVKEKFNGGDKTCPVRLPKKTDFVAVRAVCVDDEPLPAERRAFGKRLALWLGILSAAAAATVALFLWVTATFVLRCLDDFTGRLTLPDGVWAASLVGAALLAAMLTCGCALFQFFRMRRREDGDG